MDSTTRDAALQDLLTRLGQGDDQAAATALMLYEPYLRMVVRRQLSDKLRAKFDSVDVVHSVWADVLIRFREADCRFVNARHLQAFLLKAVRRRFIDHLRQHQKALECERPLAEIPPGELPPSPEPGPSEVARAHELWEKMLALCPPAHREVVRLKRVGYSAAEISVRTGYHPGSVHRILADLACRVAARKEPTPPASDPDDEKASA